MTRRGVTEENNGAEENTYKGVKFWKEETPHILKLIFGYFASAKRKNICVPENYEKYFTMSISPFKLSINEMNELLADGANPETVVSKWLEDKKYHYSISYQMEQVNVNELQDVQLQAFLRGLLCFVEKAENNKHSVISSTKTILQEGRYKLGKMEIANSTVLDWIQNKLSDKSTFCFLSRFLNTIVR